MSEQKTKDFSRTHWQAGPGNIVMSTLARDVYRGSDNFPTQANVRSICDRADFIRRQFGFNNSELPWALAHAVVERTMKTPALDKKIMDNIAFKEQVEEFTSFGDTLLTLEDAMKTQKHSPINLAMAVSIEADQQDVRGFAVENVSDIAGIIRRNDFHRLVHTAALTRQGIWRAFSDMPVRHYKTLKNSPELGFEFTKDNEVIFDEPFGLFLKSELARVAALGVSVNDGDVDKTEMVSGGCPVAHIKARFTQGDAAKYHPMLEVMYERPADDVVQSHNEHKTTVISEGLDIIATHLETANQYL